MIPLAQLLTPVAPIGAGQQPAEALGAFGRMMVSIAQERARAEENSRQFDAKHALDIEETHGRNDYYKSQAETHRAALDARAGEAREKRTNQLFDAFRKAKTPTEREQIRQELGRHGYQVDEVDTDLPLPPADPAIAAAAPPAATTPTGPAARPAKPPAASAFSRQLGAFMAGENEPTAALAPGLGGDTGGPVGSPFPWAMLGLEEPAAAPASSSGPPAPAKPSRGGKFVVKDSSGVPVLTYDEPVHQQRARDEILHALTPLVGGATTPEEQNAAEKASGVGAGALEATGDPKFALDRALDAYRTEINKYRKEYRPLHGKGGGVDGEPMSKEQRMRLGAVSDDASKIIDQVARDGNYKGVDKAGGDVRRGLEMLSGDRSGFRDTQAMAQLLREMSGLAVSDAEYRRTVGGEGAVERLKIALGQITDGGKLPDSTVRELREVFQRAERVHHLRMDEMGKQAFEQVQRRLLAATPDERDSQADAARGYFTHAYDGGERKGTAPRSPGAPKAPPAGGGGSSEQDRKNKAFKELEGLGL